MKQTKANFPRISNDMIEGGMRRARVERSKAMYSIIDTVFGRRADTDELSDA
ncbi:MAG: hypothetical protein GKR97_08155 [Rhizobiaceae bacterium]|nr:hypothetical protein [Rhizobiaceae bacterium]